MDNTKFTKGKWISNYQAGSWLIQDLETYQDGYKGSIAEVYYFDDGEDTAELNALLISKAPEMLEELKHLVKALKVVSSFGATNGIIEHAENLIKEATTL